LITGVKYILANSFELQVNLMEDDDGNIHLKNLSVHQCTTEQDGIDLLMMGNFIRQVKQNLFLAVIHILTLFVLVLVWVDRSSVVLK
jgi:hypothetical protein